jgi:hypothetical protein
MIEDLVNDGATVLNSVCPIGGRHLVFLLRKLVVIIFFIVVRDLGCATCREPDLSLRRRLAACSNGMLTLALLLGWDIATSSNVTIRFGV